MLAAFLVVVFAVPYVICMGLFYLIKELVCTIHGARRARRNGDIYMTL